jgi:amino acid transporter
MAKYAKIPVYVYTLVEYSLLLLFAYLLLQNEYMGDPFPSMSSVLLAVSLILVLAGYDFLRYSRDVASGLYTADELRTSKLEFFKLLLASLLLIMAIWAYAIAKQPRFGFLLLTVVAVLTILLMIRKIVYMRQKLKKAPVGKPKRKPAVRGRKK